MELIEDYFNISISYHNIIALCFFNIFSSFAYISNIQLDSSNQNLMGFQPR